MTTFEETPTLLELLAEEAPEPPMDSVDDELRSMPGYGMTGSEGGS